jgi:hypothetical protein
MNHAVFWDVMPYGSCTNRRFGVSVTGNVVPRSPILVAMMREVICSSETSVVARATRHHVREDGILHSHRRENFKSYIALTGWAL